jgi:hypothetical protein
MLANLDRDFEWDPTEEQGVFRGREELIELCENWLGTWKEFGELVRGREFLDREDALASFSEDRRA